MLASTWTLLSVSLHSAVAATECLVGCMLQGISPFDDENTAVWDQRQACDSFTLGCSVTAINYGFSSFRGVLWAQTSGTDGSDGCTCNLCDPGVGYPSTSYMSEEISLWSRIQCYIAASEASGYDMSVCVAAIVDQGTLPCVDDVYEAPLMGQFECEGNSLADIESSSSIDEACMWGGDTRQSAEMFSGVEPPAPDTLSPAPATAPTIDPTPSPSVVSTASPRPNTARPVSGTGTTASPAEGPTPSPGTNVVSPVPDAGANGTPTPVDAKYSTPRPSSAADDPPPTREGEGGRKPL